MNQYLICFSFKTWRGNVDMTTALPIGFEDLPEIRNKAIEILKENVSQTDINPSEIIIDNIIKMERVRND